MKIRISVIDDDGKTYEGEIELGRKEGEIKQKKTGKKTSGSWYQKGTTTEKIINLIDEGFFDENRTLKDIIEKLKSKDYHFSGPDLTLPLRNIVRRNILRKTKDLPDGTKSKQWTYVKN